MDLAKAHSTEHEEAWLQSDGLRFCHRIIRHPDPAFAPTLFVSGAFQTMDSWARFVRVFAQYTTVLLVDPPGMGRSEVLPPEFDIDVLAGCLRRIVDEHGFARINVVAASYGTPAAYRFAQLAPDRVGRVVLAGTTKELPQHLRARIRETVEIALRGDQILLAEKVIGGLLCRDPLLPVDRRGLAERVLRAGLTQMSATELHQYAANTLRLLDHPPLDVGSTIDGPEALVFTGGHDVFTTPEDGEEVARAFERAWFTVVKRADHLFHLEQFDVVINLLLRFLRGAFAEEEPVPGCGPLRRLGAAHRRPCTRGSEWTLPAPAQRPVGRSPAVTAR